MCAPTAPIFIMKICFALGLAVILLAGLPLDLMGKLPSLFSINAMNQRTNSDLIITAIAAMTIDLEETNTVWFEHQDIPVRGVETTFIVNRTEKGSQLAGQSIKLHHYRFIGPPPVGLPEIVFVPEFFDPDNRSEYIRTNGSQTGLMRFMPNPTNQYKLFLKQEGGGRYAPVSGHGHPLYSIDIMEHPYDRSYYHQSNPAIREDYKVELPNAIHLRTENSWLVIEGAHGDYIKTNFSLGVEMVVGLDAEVEIFPKGSTNACQHGRDGANMRYLYVSDQNRLEASAASKQEESTRSNRHLRLGLWDYYWKPGQTIMNGWNFLEKISPKLRSSDSSAKRLDETEKLEKNYDVRVKWTFFETSAREKIILSPQWNPDKARYYKVLAQGTLKN